MQDLRDTQPQEEFVRNRRAATAWQRFSSSGALTPIVLLVLLGAVTGIYMAHQRGRIHQLTTVTEKEETLQTVTRPGGQDVLRLTRPVRIGAAAPEFSSVTLLPGDGMLLLQTTVTLPGRADVPLLEATPKAHAASSDDAYSGAPFSALAQTRAGSQLGAGTELLGHRPSSQLGTDVVPDGNRAIARFAAAVDPAPVSQQGFEFTVESWLTGRGLDLLVSARNSSTSPRSLTLAWQPRFLAPAVGLSSLTLLTPPEANGKAAEVPLGTRDVDETYSNLKRSFLSAGPEVRLRNRADGYTLRMTALSPSIRSLHVQAAKEGRSVLLAFSTAAGKEPAETRTLVAPGGTLQWRVRLEALPESTSAYAPSAQ